MSLLYLLVVWPAGHRCDLPVLVVLSFTSPVTFFPLRGTLRRSRCVQTFFYTVDYKVRAAILIIILDWMTTLQSQYIEKLSVVTTTSLPIVGVGKRGAY